ncbi:MAG: NnrS family protein [Sphingomonadales bacterium]|nr:NnrS family protein [Sphingomonadales bacterium]
MDPPRTAACIDHCHHRRGGRKPRIVVKPAIVFVAPHRLPLLVGTVQPGALMLWWLVALSGLHFGTAAPPGDTIPPSLLHAPLLMYLAIPPFFFGFLLTVFPRWMGYPDLTKTAYAPVGFGYAAAAVTSWWGWAQVATLL